MSRLLAVLLLVAGCMPGLDQPPPRTGSAGGGAWQAGWLEIHHIDVGRGVSTLLVSPAGRSLLIDVGEAAWDRKDGAEIVGSYVQKVIGGKHLDYVVLTHFHVDHTGAPGVGGLWHLVHEQGFSVGALIHRDLNRYVGTSGGMLKAWRTFLTSPLGKSLSPRIARLWDRSIDLGSGVEIRVVAVDGSGDLIAGDFSTEFAPPDENDFSIALLLRYGRLDYLTAGDLSGEFLIRQGYAYHDLETPLAARVQDVDIYRVSHHGSVHSSNPTLLTQIRPRVAILQVGDENTDGHPHQVLVDRLLAIAPLYLTQRGDPGTKVKSARIAGTVVVRSYRGEDYTVHGDVYLASDPPRVDRDQDGYFREADPDDGDDSVVPGWSGGCDPDRQPCARSLLPAL